MLPRTLHRADGRRNLALTIMPGAQLMIIVDPSIICANIILRNNILVTA
jgi:hypothetical protein